MSVHFHRDPHYLRDFPLAGTAGFPRVACGRGPAVLLEPGSDVTDDYNRVTCDGCNVVLVGLARTRGGTWCCVPLGLEIAARDLQPPQDQSDEVGVRLVLEEGAW